MLNTGSESFAADVEHAVQPLRVPEGTSFPLSYTQLCFWFVSVALDQTANVLARLMIDGELSVACLERAINQLIRRHGALRACISDWNPVQVVLPARHFDLAFRDTTNLSEADRSALVAGVSHRFLSQRFALSDPPLLRATLFRIGERSHLLLLCFPHIVADGGAVHLFQQQLTVTYGRLLQGLAPAGGDESPQISEFVAAERDRNRMRGRQAEQFWRERLAGHPYARFPGNCIAQGEIAYRDRDLEFPADSLENLTRLARLHKATLQMCLIAALGLSLYAVTGQARLSIHSVLESREHPETEGLMAPLLQVMPVPFAYTAGMTFEDALAAVRKHVIAAYEHRDCPWSLPLGILAQQRWQDSPRALIGLILLGSALFCVLFRKARLYRRFLADFLFMDHFPPRSLREVLPGSRRRNASRGAPSPVVNINVLQGVFKRERPGIEPHGIRISQLNERREFLLAEATPDTWESDTINVYVTQGVSGKPTIRIACHCLSEAGMSRLSGALLDVLRSVPSCS